MSNKGKKCPCIRKELKTTSSTLKIIAEDTRLRIICLLGKKELCVCELVSALGLPHNLILHHLKALAACGLVEKREEGRFSFYRLNPKSLSLFKKQFMKLIG